MTLSRGHLNAALSLPTAATMGLLVTAAVGGGGEGGDVLVGVAGVRARTVSAR
jgi:hypothetical protein